MAQFPFDKLKPMPASLEGDADRLSLVIPLKPFDVDSAVVSTRICLEEINLPTANLANLAGNSFRFPTNPHDGCIDGSVYIVHAHHPVEVSLIAFGERQANQVPIQITARFAFSYEGLMDFEDGDHIIETVIRHDSP